MTFVALLGALAAVLTAQGDADGVVATFELRGKDAVVTRPDLCREVALRLRRSDDGKAALKLLVDRALVAEAASAQRIVPAPADVAARTREIESALTAKGTTLARFLDDRGLSRAEFERDYVVAAIAHERLVMRAVGLSDRADVTPELLELWLAEARQKQGVITDEAELPADAVARIGERPLGLLELGSVLLQNLGRDERLKFVRRIVVRRLLGDEAQALGIEVAEADTKAEIARRRQDVEADPKYGGVGYDDLLLQLQGLTVDELARSPQLVATVQHREIVARRHPDAELRRMLADDRDSILRRHGEQRQVRLILLRARDDPNELVPRTFAAAIQEARGIRERIADGLPFEQAARVHSDDPYSKVRGGDVGLVFRASADLPEPLLEQAFALREGEVSEPVRIDAGVALLQVARIVPAPADEVLLERLREELADRFLRELVDRAHIELRR